MIKDCKICGVSDSNILNFIINHPFPPKFIGFICNYPKSFRYVDPTNLKKLLNVKKKKSEFVAVLVKPENKILEEIKDLPFDYYQLYDCSPEKVRDIREKYQKKIITAFTVQEKKDVDNHKMFSDVKDIKLNKKIMLAGNIQYNDNLEKYKNIADYIDLSGGLETSRLKDKTKIEIFLNNINKIKNEA